MSFIPITLVLFSRSVPDLSMNSLFVPLFR